jgi:hypothetical protein
LEGREFLPRKKRKGAKYTKRGKPHINASERGFGIWPQKGTKEWDKMREGNETGFE